MSRSASLSEFVDALEEALRDYIDSERSRMEAERDFLQAVLDGSSDGATAEDVSTDLTRQYLEGYLSTFVPIEQDISGAGD